MHDSKKIVSEHFSRNVDYWKTIYGTETEDDSFSMNMRHRMDAVFESLDGYAKGRSLRVLDAGCGPGVFMKEALTRGHSVTGMDASEQMFKEARKIAGDYPHGRVVCVHGDVEQMPFEDNSFDAVLCVGVLSYLQEDMKAVSEISRVLKNGGLAIVALPNLFRLSVWLDPYYYLNRGLRLIFGKVLGQAVKQDDINTIMRKYRYGQLSGAFIRNNLHKAGCAGLGFGPMTFWRKEIFGKGLSIMISDAIEKGSRSILPFMKIIANHWVISLKKGG